MNLYDILMSDNVASEIIDNLDYILMIIPELKYTIGFDQNNPRHHLDVFGHTLEALSYSKQDFQVRLCLLLHDIGKPFCYQDKTNKRSFIGHPLVSANIAKNILERLEFDEVFINECWYLIRNHDTPITERDIYDDKNIESIRLSIQTCDIYAHNPKQLEPLTKYLTRTKRLFK